MSTFSERGATSAAYELVSSQSPVTEVGRSFIVRYFLAYIGVQLALLAPAAMMLAVRVGQIAPETKEAALGAILGIGAVVALIANPLFGRLSDMTRSRLGRRNPWILGGVLVGTVACVAIAFSESLLVIGICWALAQGGYNAALAAIIAVVPDRVPEHQRGRISALSGMAIYIALLLSSFILSTLNSGAGIFIIPAAIGLVTVLLFALTYDDRPTKSLIRSQGILEGFLGSFWVNPVKEADFGWAWVSRFMVIFGFSVLMTYQVYFLGDMLKVAPAGIGSIMFNSMLITAACVIASSFVSGWLSDRIGRRKVFVIGAATIYAIGIAILIFADTLALYYVSIAVSAVGFGVYFAVDQALVVDVLPDRETDAAKNLGVLNIANTVPQALAPAVAPIFLAIGAGDVGNYPLLYAVASIAAFLGAVSILPVKGVR